MGLIGQLFGGDKKIIHSMVPLSTTSKADEQRITETLGLRRLESMPAQAARAFQLSCDPKSTLDDFVKIIESDEVLSARIIKIANSVYFRRGDQAKDITNAVANIGLNEIRCLLSATMLKSLLRGNSKYRNALWGNSVATAIAAKHLAQFTNIPEGEAFLCGLLHDVGKLILLQRLPLQYEKIIQNHLNGSKESVILEEEGLDLSHIEVGKWLAERWGFPESIRRAITFHHNRWPENPSEKGKQTTPAMLVKCSDILAHSHRLGHLTTTSQLGIMSQEKREFIVSQLEIEDQTLKGVESTITRQFDAEFSMYNMDGA